MNNRDVMVVPEAGGKGGETRRQGGDGVEEELEEKLEKVKTPTWKNT
jgi:hypothetical protein